MPENKIDTTLLKKSVTKEDYTDNKYGAYFLRVLGWNQNPKLPDDITDLSVVDSDKVTLATLDNESYWAGAVAIAITKITSLAWEIKSDVVLRTKRGHDLLNSADLGKGWVSFLSKLVSDFLLTNNGCFIEVVHETLSPLSPIIGLVPLDTMRCTRTGDPTNPVVYTDLKGKGHLLAAHQVIEMADMPSNRASMLGSGKCAAYRSYHSIYKLASVEKYVSDKVSGRRPLAVYLINGLNDMQLRSVLNTANVEADGRGAVAYMGAIMATVPGDTNPGVATIPLASLPDGFDRKTELELTLLAYANNLGLDVQDLQPLTGRSLGTGAQSQVLNEKSKGKGLAAFRQQLIHNLNNWVLPEATVFNFIEKDWRDRNLQAEYNQKVEMYLGDAVQKFIITPQEAKQVLVDEEILPDEFLPVDETPDDTLADDEKPEDDTTKNEPPPETPSEDQIPSEELTQKDYVDDLMEETITEAQRLAEKIKKRKRGKK